LDGDDGRRRRDRARKQRDAYDYDREEYDRRDDSARPDNVGPLVLRRQHNINVWAHADFSESAMG